MPSTPACDIGMRVRVFDWKPYLEARGFGVEVLAPCTEEEWRSFSGEGMAADSGYHGATVRALESHLESLVRADVVLLHRGLLPFSPYRRPTLELLLMRRNPRVVFDLFDSLWENSARQHRQSLSPVGRWLSPLDSVERILESAAAVTVSNDYLAEHARRKNPRTHLIPMLLNVESYRARVHASHQTVVLGWMGNPGNLDRLLAVAPPLARAALSVPLQLMVVSSAPFEAPGLTVENRSHPWSADSEQADLASFDVGLLPMFDNPVDRGKSPLKLLQYAAAGLPIIASPVAIDRSVWVHGESLLYASTEEEWTSHAVTLARDPSLRSTLGAAARRLVQERFTHEAWADRFTAILREAAAFGRATTPGGTA